MVYNQLAQALLELLSSGNPEEKMSAAQGVLQMNPNKYFIDSILQARSSNASSLPLILDAPAAPSTAPVSAQQPAEATAQVQEQQQASPAAKKPGTKKKGKTKEDKKEEVAITPVSPIDATTPATPPQSPPPPRVQSPQSPQEEPPRAKEVAQQPAEQPKPPAEQPQQPARQQQTGGATSNVGIVASNPAYPFTATSITVDPNDPKYDPQQFLSYIRQGAQQTSAAPAPSMQTQPPVFDNSIIQRGKEEFLKEVAETGGPKVLYNGGPAGVTLPPIQWEAYTKAGDFDKLFQEQIGPQLTKQFYTEVFKRGWSPEDPVMQQTLQNVLSEAYQRYGSIIDYYRLREKVLDSQNAGAQLNEQELLQAYQLGLIIPKVEQVKDPKTGNVSQQVVGWMIAPGADISKQQSGSMELQADKIMFDPLLTFHVPTRDVSGPFWEQQQKLARKGGQAAMFNYVPMEISAPTYKSPPLVMPSLRTSSQSSMTYRQPNLAIPPQPRSGGAGPRSVGSTQIIELQPASLPFLYSSSKSATLTDVYRPADVFLGNREKEVISPNGGLAHMPAVLNNNAGNISASERKSIQNMLDNVFGPGHGAAVFNQGVDGNAVLKATQGSNVMDAAKGDGWRKLMPTFLRSDAVASAVSYLVRNVPTLINQGPGSTGGEIASGELINIVKNLAGSDDPQKIDEILANAGKTEKGKKAFQVLTEILDEGFKSWAGILANGSSVGTEKLSFDVGGKTRVYTRQQLAMMFAALSQFMTGETLANALAAAKVKTGKIDWGTGLNNINVVNASTEFVRTHKDAYLTQGKLAEAGDPVHMKKVLNELPAYNNKRNAPRFVAATVFPYLALPFLKEMSW